MILLEIITVALFAVTTCESEHVEKISTNKDGSLHDLYRLPTTTYPSHYDVELFFDLNDEDTFSGYVIITIMANETTTREIVLHASNTEITSIDIFKQSDANRSQNLFNSYSLITDDRELLIITTTEDLLVTEHYLVEINYTAQYGKDLLGVYLSDYTNELNETRKVAVSQSCPTYARRILPCYDEPALKAIFKMTIFAPLQYTSVLFNTEEISTEVSSSDHEGFVKHEFAETLPMSSYLLALSISNFVGVSNEQNPQYHGLIRIFSRPGTQHLTGWSMDILERSLLALEEYTEMEYSKKKFDNVAVPNFLFGAMENWGLVVYRESAILVDLNTTAREIIARVGLIVPHENAHQWFGNEVSPEWWDYIWLNEGFSSLFEYVILDQIEPSWRIMDRFYIAKFGVALDDSSSASTPMTYNVYTPEQILHNFNSIVYTKAASVLYMLRSALSEEVFRKAVVYFLESKSRSAATPLDLSNAFDRAINEMYISLPQPFSVILDSWTNQAGLPVLTVRRQTSNGNNLILTQERFLSNTLETSDNLWFIPINVATSNNFNFETTIAEYWTQPKNVETVFTVEGLADSDWYIINKQGTGYYRVNYDVSNWLAIARQLNSVTYDNIHLRSRSQILDDAFRMAETERINYTIYLDLISYLSRETEYLPWESAKAGLTFLTRVLTGSSNYALFKDFMVNLSKEAFDRVGFIASTSDEHLTPLHRHVIIDFSCKFGNHNCTDAAYEALNALRSTEDKIPHIDIKSRLYCESLRSGKEFVFDFLWDQYQVLDNTEKIHVLQQIGCTSSKENISMILNELSVGNSVVRMEDKYLILTSLINSGGGVENLDTAFDFIIQNYILLRNSFSTSNWMQIFSALGNHLTTEEHLSKFTDFLEQNRAFMAAEEISGAEAALVSLNATRIWSDKHIEDVNNWLVQNVHVSAASKIHLYWTLPVVLYFTSRFAL